MTVDRRQQHAIATPAALSRRTAAVAERVAHDGQPRLVLQGREALRGTRGARRLQPRRAKRSRAWADRSYREYAEGYCGQQRVLPVAGVLKRKDDDEIQGCADDHQRSRDDFDGSLTVSHGSHAKHGRSRVLATVAAMRLGDAEDGVL